MRNPKRIDDFCEKLKYYWKIVPDWRFGQLMCNVLGEIAVKKDPFFIEESEMIEAFDKYFNITREEN